MPQQQRVEWPAIRLAEASGISQVTLFYDPDYVEPTRSGAVFPNLERVGFVPDRRLLRAMDLGQPEAGWQEFGLMGNRPGSDRVIGNVRVGMTAWVLLFEWNPQRSAWEALLEAQDTLRPERLSLGPDFLLPLMFLTRMAFFPIGPGRGNTAARWTPCMASAQEQLAPLITGFLVTWVHGSSQAAARYRQSIERLPKHGIDQRQALSDWRQTFGMELLTALETAERLEPLIIRELEAASVRLWTEPTFPVPKGTMRFISGLLPIARWQPTPPGPREIPERASTSLETLLRWWKAWRLREGTKA
jgi:hypothetical protein